MSTRGLKVSSEQGQSNNKQMFVVNKLVWIKYNVNIIVLWCWLLSDFYFLGVCYPVTDLNVSSSGIELPGFLVNYPSINLMFVAQYRKPDKRYWGNKQCLDKLCDIFSCIYNFKINVLL